MESQQKVNGVHDHEGSNGRIRPISDYILRLVATVTTMTAAIVLGLAKETKTVPVTVFPGRPPIPITATAKSSYSSAFIFFVVANAIICVYSTISLAMSIANKGRKTSLALLITAADTVAVALLFSGNGAAAAIGVVGQKGISHVRWNKVCNVFTKYCNHVTAAVIVSLVGCLAYVMLVLLALVGLHKKVT